MKERGSGREHQVDTRGRCVRECAWESNLGLAEAGGNQASRVNVQVPLLSALVVRVQRRDPAVQGADDHQRSAHTREDSHNENSQV